jgi:hypothetical protein
MVRNLGTVVQRLERIPERVKEAVDRQLQQEAADLAAAVQRAAPVETGELVASIRVDKNPRRDLSYQIVVGGPAPLSVEFGHRAANGVHVPARPFAYPTARARKSAVRRRVRATAKRAFKEEFPGG